MALVIGQSGYEHLTALPNPRNDAKAIDRLLADLGFEVDSVADADRRKLSRALDRFAEDAADADVALIYYSGHGIEAGGENFLVPVDADLSALEHAGETLVPLSQVLAKLQASVPITIFLLDACRDSPFPPGAVVRLEPGAVPEPIAAAGLSAPRGASALIAPQAVRSGGAAAASFGAVVGFAAAPGRVALDGDPGGNSPYAAALIKHLSAGGYDFSDVMTMVSEEVWLKTRAAQTPWTNTSLRRQLYFGERAETGNGDEAAIRGERRGLLLRIAALGSAERQQVASRAAEGGVPMDALFAMLSAAGTEAPRDPEQLDRLLREQAERLRSLLADRKALQTTDPEIRQLAALSERAVAEGALKAAIGLNERAKTRVAALSARLDETEAQIAQRRIEYAAVYAKSAETYGLAGDHAAAARDYEKAFQQVERWDRTLAWRYRSGQADALVKRGFYGADNEALARSVDIWRSALDLAPRQERPVDWAHTQGELGFALLTLGDRIGNGDMVAASVDALEQAAAAAPFASAPQEWADIQGKLASALLTAGAQDRGTERLEKAAAALRDALDVRTRESAPAEWARLQNRLGIALYTIGFRNGGQEDMRQAIAVLDQALLERPRDKVPLDWAQTQNNRALVLSGLAQRNGRIEELQAAIAAYEGALEVQTRQLSPLLWAETQANLGGVYYQLSLREVDWANLARAADAFRASLEVVTRQMSPLRWAALQDNLGLALKALGERRTDETMVEEAIAAFHSALEERRRDRVPFDWANTLSHLATSQYGLGAYRRDAAMLRDAIANTRAVLEVNTRDVLPVEWARTTNNLALMLHALGALEQDPAVLEQAAATYREALAENRRDRTPVDWGLMQYNIAQVLVDLGSFRKDRAVLAQAADAVRNARDAYQQAGIREFDSSFDSVELRIQLADLQVQVADKIRAAQASEHEGKNDEAAK